MKSHVGVWAASLNEKIQAFLYVSYLVYCNNLKGILSSEHPYTLQALLQPDQSYCACLTDEWVEMIPDQLVKQPDIDSWLSPMIDAS